MFHNPYNNLNVYAYTFLLRIARNSEDGNSDTNESNFKTIMKVHVILCLRSIEECICKQVLEIKNV